MNNPLRHPEQINPKIAADVQAALEKNRAAGRVVDGDFADSIASSSLADVVRADTAEAKEAGILVGSGLDQVSSPEIKRNFEAAFVETEKLFARISITPPTPEEFTAAGVDFARLEREFERMTVEGLEPQLVVTQRLPLVDGRPIYDAQQEWTGLRKDWVNLYSAMTGDNTIPNNPFRINDSDEGLWISSDIRASADDLLAQEEERILYDIDIHMAFYGRFFSPGDAYWTVALLPTTDRPQEPGVLREEYEDFDDPKSSKLATISQYLTLQAIRIQSGQPPVDEVATYSWLQGTFTDSAQVSCGYWDFHSHRLSVSLIDDYQDIDTGVRLPVWG